MIRHQGQEVGLGDQALGRDRGDLRVQRGVHLGAPGSGGGVGLLGIGEAADGYDQIALGVAHQVLDHSLGLRVGLAAKVGAKAVVGGEAHVVVMGHHQPGDLVGAQAGHPIAQHHARHAADLLETLGDQSQRRRPPLIGGEAHEAVAAPGEHGAEHLQAAAGVQSITRCPPGAGTQGRYTRRSRRWRALASATSRRRLRAEPAYPAARATGSRRLAEIRPSVTLTRSATRSATWSVFFWRSWAWWRDAHRRAGARHPSHRLVGGAAQLRGGAIAAELVVGAHDLHPFPR